MYIGDKNLIFILSVIFLWNNLISGQNDITVPELKEHVYFLASDSLKGRKPGTPEGRIAVEYIKRSISFPEVKFLGQDGFQYFQVITGIEPGKKNKLSIQGIRGEVGDNFNPIGFTENATVKAAAIFAGYGLEIDEDSLKWDDYNGIDVSGKWIVVLRGHPEMNQRSSKFEMYADPREKVIRAKDKGARGVIFVSGLEFDKDDELMQVNLDRNAATVGIPVLHVKRELADKLFQKTGKNTASVEKEIMALKVPNSFALDIEIDATTDVIRTKANTQNLVALLEGSDPVLKNEYVVLGGHYDHLGFGGPGSGSRQPDTIAIHNGADDNASGISAIIEIFEKLYGKRENLKRSVLFIAFGAEEMGVLGSNFFVNNPIIDLDKIRFMINIDMIGRMDPEEVAFTLGGVGTGVGLQNMIERYVQDRNLNIRYSPEGFGPSDHASFYAKDKSVLFFFANAHEDYHTPTDDAEYLNYEGIKNIADTAHDLLMEIVNMPEAIAFKEAGPKSRPSSRYGLKATLGLQPDHAAADIKGMRVEQVLKDRPAFRAGMQKGDIIIAIEGKEVSNIYDYMYRLKEFRPGDRISVDVKRGDDMKILIVDL